jgi:hypothetical protein
LRRASNIFSIGAAIISSSVKATEVFNEELCAGMFLIEMISCNGERSENKN